MKTTIYVIILISMLFYVADTSIQLKPLKISFGNLSMAFALLFFYVALIFMTYSIYSKAYEKGLGKGCEISRESAIEAAKQLIEESKNKLQ